MNKNPLSVLVINDDNDAIKKKLLHLTESSGHSADISGRCDDALLKLSQGNFDLAFIDVNLPDGDGIELIGKAKVLCPELSIVAITGRITRSDELRIREQRVICILIKPFSRKVFQAILDHVARRKGFNCETDNMNFGRDGPK